ncbi:hypothetical protein EDC01DRAFT_685735 [Geopyxis carbonaria]|nr:hypothetical protein EDC01DRAFT_685735 [Geopyxis carbonaria]
MSSNKMAYDSDEDDGDFETDGNPRGEEQDDDEPARGAPAADEDNDNGNDDDEEDDDDEEEDEDEEEEPQQKRRRRTLRNFIDDEAAVEDDEEEEEEAAEEGFFIANEDEPDVADRPEFNQDHRHRELDRQHEQQQFEDMEAIALSIKERHGRSKRGRAHDSGLVPRRLLLPSVQDPSIWGLKCRPGKEKETLYSILKKMEEMELGKNPMTILSAFQREAMLGYIYVEAYKLGDIMDSLRGVSGVYLTAKNVLVPIKEMPDLMNVVKTPEILPGAWVRFKRGKYQGDLAQVENILASGLEVRIRMVPRLDYGNSSDRKNMDDANKRKRGSNFNKSNTVAGRPPQRLFSEIEAAKNHSKLLQKGTTSSRGKKNFTYANEEYEDGYLVKDVRLNLITTEQAKPTLSEVAMFASTVEEGAETLDLNALAASLNSNNSSYQVGDTVEVYDGEQKNVMGKVVSVQNDIVTMHVTSEGNNLRGQKIEVPFKGLRKRFREGDHVKVTGGRYKDETGTVVRIIEDKVTLVTGEENIQEITVFSKDLREANEAGGPSGSIYDLHDLVQLDAATVACVVKVEKATLRVLDQQGDVRTIVPSQISDKVNRRNAVATDRNGSEIRVGDTVKEIAGETRTGVVLHVFRAFLFLHGRENTENSGVFVCRATNVATIVAKGGRVDAKNTGPDLSKMNPDMLRKGQNGSTQPMMPPPTRVGGRDRTIGQTVTVRQGPYKGLMGIIKDASDTHARVELHTKNRTISIEKVKLGFRDSITGATKTFQDFVRPGGRGQGGGDFLGSRTPQSAPSWSGGSRTPQGDHGGSGGRTPAWMANSGSRTPAWMSGSGGDGGRTPAYQSGNKTPAWAGDGSRSSYAGNRTPAWNPSSRTPYIADSERSAWDAGSKTPGRPSALDSWGDSGSSSATTARTPGAYNAASPEFSAPAYGSAPTPGNPMSAPTPSAPTPGPFSAPTPGAGSWGADSAPTPGASGYGSGRGGAFPNTPGAWGAGDDDDAPRYAPPSP